MLAFIHIEIYQRLRIVRPFDTRIGDLVDGGEHAIGSVKLNVGAIHPENVGKFVALGLGAQLVPVVLEPSQVRLDPDVWVLLSEGLKVFLNCLRLVLVPVSQGQLSRRFGVDAWRDVRLIFVIR